MLIKKTKKIKKILKNRIPDTERRIQKKKIAFTSVNQRPIYFQHGFTRIYTHGLGYQYVGWQPVPPGRQNREYRR